MRSTPNHSSPDQLIALPVREIPNGPRDVTKIEIIIYDTQSVFVVQQLGYVRPLTPIRQTTLSTKCAATVIFGTNQSDRNLLMPQFSDCKE